MHHALRVLRGVPPKTTSTLKFNLDAPLAACATVGRGLETLVPAELDYCIYVELMFILYVIAGQLVESTYKIPKLSFS